jgi:hypothetical protein
MESNFQVPARVAKRAAEMAEGRLAEVRRARTNDILMYAKCIERLGEEIKKAPEELKAQAAQWAECTARLKAAGFEAESGSWWAPFEMTSARRLTAVYRAVGRLDGSKAEKELVKDADGHVVPGRVLVSMPCVAFPLLTVSFERRLTHKDPCRVEEVVEPARVTHKLVCRREG